VDTKEKYADAFKFKEVSKNDNVVEIMEELEIAQKNLNANPNN